ncbi:MAG: hypothetical protein V9G98_04140 [Candidatus Competibacter sp.]
MSLPSLLLLSTGQKYSAAGQFYLSAYGGATGRRQTRVHLRRSPTSTGRRRAPTLAKQDALQPAQADPGFAQREREPEIELDQLHQQPPIFARQGVRLEAFNQRLAFFAAQLHLVRRHFHRGGGQEFFQN